MPQKYVGRERTPKEKREEKEKGQERWSCVSSFEICIYIFIFLYNNIFIFLYNNIKL